MKVIQFIKNTLNQLYDLTSVDIQEKIIGILTELDNN